MIDEDEVGLKKKPEDTRYIKEIIGTRGGGGGGERCVKPEVT